MLTCLSTIVKFRLQNVKWNDCIMIKYTLNFLNSHKLQLTIFVIVGLVTFCINFGSFHVFYAIAHLDYKLAASIAYIITVITHFLLHRTFTFGAADQKMVHSLWKYLFMLGLNYTILLIVMWFFVDIINCSPYIGLIASTGFTAFINFFMMKYFVFHSKLEFEQSHMQKHAFMDRRT